MHVKMKNIPSAIDLESLPGPARGKWPAGYFRDDVVWSPTKEFFALAYSIAEVSMCNDVGCLLWGAHRNAKAEILHNPQQLRVSCWRVPFCKWIDESTFVVKAQRIGPKGARTPAIAIQVHRGFEIVPNSSSANDWIDEITKVPGEFTGFDETALLNQIDEI